MINKSVLVSVIIPCRNEEKYIGKCLDSLIQQDWPKDKLEILVIDGMSEDKTKELVKNYSQNHFFIKLLENPQRFTPFGLNIGIKNARGEIIIRMDAHAGYEKDYVSKCVKYLEEYKVDNVGGIIKTLPSKNTLIAKSIAFSLSHPFGAMSFFRLGSKKARFVDTVSGGCYKKEVFEKIGLFNENLIRSQDMEFNKRLVEAGGKILLVPDILAFYYPQSTFSGFLKHNFDDGVWVTYPLRFGIKIFKIRHLLPLGFVLGFLGLFLSSFFSKISLFLFLTIILFYLLLNLLSSLQIVLREKDLRYLFLMPIVFATRHFGYGLGSIFGLMKLLLPKKSAS